MLRTVGLCVIVISGVGCGFAMSNELGRRKKMMEMILRMIILLRGEIRYGNKSLYDAFTGASGKLEGKYREFFILTAQKMKEKTGDSFGTIFRESAGKCLDLDCLSQEERDRFYSLGDQLKNSFFTSIFSPFSTCPSIPIYTLNPNNSPAISRTAIRERFSLPQRLVYNG